MATATEETPDNRTDTEVLNDALAIKSVKLTEFFPKPEDQRSVISYGYFSGKNGRENQQKARKLIKLLRYLESIQLSIDECKRDYVTKRLFVTREHIERIDAKLADEDDAGEIYKLASALDKLCEVERQLAGRPLPGSLKPVQTKRREVVDAEPEHVTRYEQIVTPVQTTITETSDAMTTETSDGSPAEPLPPD